MFTDEVGDNLVEVKKYDEAEPIRTPEPELAEAETEDTDVVFDDIKIDEIEESFNNVENVRYMDSVTDRRRENINLKIFGNPNIRKSQVQYTLPCYSKETSEMFFSTPNKYSPHVSELRGHPPEV